MNTKIRRKDYGSTFLASDMLDALALMGISLALFVAFYYQLAFDELPCPLCLLQRAGLILVGIGFAMNVRYGSRSMHYGFVIVSAVVTGIIAARQVLLHVTPGSVAYGSALWGLHFYTWCLIALVLIVLFVAGLLVLRSARKRARPASMSLFGRIAMAIFAFVTIANLISTLLECGGGQCPDDPVRYEFLDRFRNT